MSVIKKTINKKSVPSKCSVVEYPFNGNDMDIGIFYIKDEYPLTGFCINKKRGVVLPIDFIGIHVRKTRHRHAVNLYHVGFGNFKIEHRQIFFHIGNIC